MEIKSKLAVDGPVIGSRSDQFAYIYTRLEKSAQNMTVAFVEKGGPDGLFDPDRYLQYLASIYGDPNSQARALDRLRHLRQKENEKFSAFLPRFEKELADSGGAEWPPYMQINQLEGALNLTMRDRLVGLINLPRDDFGAYIQILQTIGSMLDSLAYAKKGRAQRASPSPERKKRSQVKEVTEASVADDQMDWEPTRANSALIRDNRKLEGRRAKWVDKKEIDRRAKEGRCFRCGRSGCRVEKCPLKPARRPSDSSDRVSKNKKGKPVKKAMVEESDDETAVVSNPSNDDSGKE